MILNITEEQKKVIEEHGHMVIEFKKWCRDIAGRITDVWNAIMFYLQQFVERVIVPCLDRLVDAVKKAFIIFEERFIDKAKANLYAERQKYPFVRRIGDKYKPRYSQSVYLHRCRNNC